MTREFEEIKEFVSNKMSMQQVYQPVMLSTLLSNNGQATTEQIARAILDFDISQVEYFQNITNNMVGKVLRSHGLVTKEHRRPIYYLEGFTKLDQQEVDELLQLCSDKVEEFLEKRGNTIWEHRRRNRRPVPGSVRYEVLKRAKHRCELCGVSAEEKALEVDHIQPKRQGGKDDINNYQALCYSCNSNKRDLDDTDFRGMDDDYEVREDGCLFCEAAKEREILLENELAYVIDDGFPVTEGHSLVIPKRHVETYFELGQAEVNAINQLLKKRKEQLEESDTSISGFNIGMNSGASAGQTLFHCHVHLIPRRVGDVENPRGGVRHVIPSKGNY